VFPAPPLAFWPGLRTLEGYARDACYTDPRAKAKDRTELSPSSGDRG
jgi:hypothetical protein